MAEPFPQYRKEISLLGASGSVGQSCAQVIAGHREAFSVLGVTGAHNIKILAQRAIELEARIAITASANRYDELKRALSGTGIECQAGEAALAELASRTKDLVVSAITGIAGLRPSHAALEAGRNLALANKESLIASGFLLMDLARKTGAKILPIDSEHNAIFQCLEQQDKARLHSLVLTASGGPFLRIPLKELAKVSVEQALKHPRWQMGKKVTIDSATMMNKGLEVIEASYLFGVPGTKITVFIHPQSLVHSLVRFEDGSCLAQLGAADMRIPVSHALGYPRRLALPVPVIGPEQLSELSFELPDNQRFPALKLAFEALEDGGGAPLVLNAANEVAVEAFLQGKIPFPAIAQTVEKMLEDNPMPAPDSLEGILDMDASIRQKANTVLT